MTKIKILKQNQKIALVECDGHTGFGVSGEDIVCSALSSIVQTAALGLLSVAQIDLKLVRDDKRGYLKMEIPKGLSDLQQTKTDAILETMCLGIADLYEGYSDFIEMEVITK